MAIFTLSRMKNNTLIVFGIGQTEYGLTVYEGEEKVWIDITAFVLPKGSPLLASDVLLKFLLLLKTSNLAIIHHFAEWLQ